MNLTTSISTLTLIAGFGSALVAGVFFAFSTFVMAGLGRVEANQGMRAMQGINEAAVGPGLMVLMFGTALAAIALGAIVIFTKHSIPGAPWLLAGLVIYIAGTMVVTGVGNVPMNDALAAMSTTEPSGQAYWSTYLSRWTLLNHVRTIASGLAAGAFFWGYVLGRA